MENVSGRHVLKHSSSQMSAPYISVTILSSTLVSHDLVIINTQPRKLHGEYHIKNGKPCQEMFLRTLCDVESTPSARETTRRLWKNHFSSIHSLRFQLIISSIPSFQVPTKAFAGIPYVEVLSFISTNMKFFNRFKVNVPVLKSVFSFLFFPFNSSQLEINLFAATESQQ